MIDDTSQEFISRHIGPSKKDQERILEYIGSKSLDQLIQNTVPKNILLKDILILNPEIKNINFIYSLLDVNKYDNCETFEKKN